MEQILESLSNSVPRSKDEYMGEDGLLYCRKCNTPIQTVVDFLGTKRKVFCICECERKRIQDEAEQDKQKERNRKRSVCFAETNMHSWTFENDDGKNPKMTEVMKNYVEHFSEFRRDGKGLILYGSVGTGKTYYAACIGNALIDRDYTVLMTNFATLVNKLQGMFEGKQEYIASLNRYSLLIIDDLGAERKSEFMQEQIFNIIDARYRSGLPMIITTNLSAEELKKPQEVAYARIYDRILERCHPVKVDGGSRRRDKLKDSFEETQRKLGL